MHEKLSWRIRFTFFLLLIAPVMQAQLAGWRVSVYTEADGLSSNIIRCVLQDSRGMLWIGTADGLNTYDGYTFNTFRKSGTNANTIRGNFITELMEDRVGDIWIGYMAGGVSCYNISTGIFRHFPLKELSDEMNNKAAEISVLYADGKNEIWIGVVGAGFFKLDKSTGKWTHRDLTNDKGVPLTSSKDKSYNTVFATHEDKNDVMWLATAAGLYYYQTRTDELKLIKDPAQDVNGDYNDLFLNILKQDDQLWMGAWSGGLNSYNIQTKAWAHYKYDHYSPTTNIINQTLSIPGDSILLLSDDKGLGSFDKKNKRFFFEKGSPFLKQNDYKSMYRDRTGNIWIASGRGLYKLSRSSPKFSFIELARKKNENPAAQAVQAVFENDSFTLTGSSYGDGLYVTDKKTGIKWNIGFEIIPGEEPELLVRDILQDSSGTVWVLTRDYLYYLDRSCRQLKRKTQPPLQWGKRSNYFYRMAVDKKGRLWIASLRNGLFLYDALKDVFLKNYSSEAEPADEIPTSNIRSVVCDDHGDIWFAGTRGFLARVDVTSGIIQSYPTYFPKSDINANTVYDLMADKQTLWAGTDVGLLRYAINGKDLVFKKNYTSENGVGSDIVKSLSKAKDGNIWCLTETALCRVDPATDIVANYGSEEGLVEFGIGNRVQSLCNGQMTIGTLKGRYLFDPVYLAGLQQSTPILITAFNVNGIARFYGTELATNGIVKLKPSDNQFSFEFTNIDFNRTSKQQYAYMMEGLDTGWTRSYNRYAGYGNLEPGKYVFKVRAIGNTHKQDSEVVAVPIQITGHFYTFTWFWVLAALLVFGVMYAVYAIRLRNQRHLYALRNRAELLEKEKAMVMYESLKQHLNPHFLFNSLTSLGSLIHINQKLAADFLEGLSRIYRYILLNRDKELVSLSSEIQFCETYIHLQKTRFEDALRVQLDVASRFYDLKIAPVTLQNLLENAIKHNIATEEDPLLIEIFVNDEQQLAVKNNLNLKDFVETSNGQGLASMNTLYLHLAGKQIEMEKTTEHFMVKVPLL